MTDLKSLVFYLGLYSLSQAQAAAAHQYYRPYRYDFRHDGRISPLPLTGTSPPHTATPVVHSSGSKWQYHGEYSWYFPKETSTPNGGDHNGYAWPHATGAHAEHQYEYHGFPPSPPRETRAPYPSHSAVYPSHSAIDVGKSTRSTNSTSKVVVLPTTQSGPSLIYRPSSARPSKVSTKVSPSVSIPVVEGTTIEKVTLVPTPFSQTPRFITKRSSPPAQKPSTSQASSRKNGSKPTSPATCPSGKFYTVVSGDTCVKIASQQKVPVGKLISQNKLPSTCNNLQIGQKLCVPQCKSYIVQPGDFCFKITEKFNVELSDFLTANP